MRYIVHTTDGSQLPQNSEPISSDFYHDDLQRLLFRSASRELLWINIALLYTRHAELSFNWYVQHQPLAGLEGVGWMRTWTIVCIFLFKADHQLLLGQRFRVYSNLRKKNSDSITRSGNFPLSIKSCTRGKIVGVCFIRLVYRISTVKRRTNWYIDSVISASKVGYLLGVERH